MMVTCLGGEGSVGLRVYIVGKEGSVQSMVIASYSLYSQLFCKYVRTIVLELV